MNMCEVSNCDVEFIGRNMVTSFSVVVADWSVAWRWRHSESWSFIGSGSDRPHTDDRMSDIAMADVSAYG